MPHIILEGPVDLKKYFEHFQPYSSQAAGEILKLQAAFISKEADSMLIEALAKESGPPNRFFVQIIAKDCRTTVKIYPGTDPEKTASVKKVIALAAKQIKDKSPEAQYGATNLREYLL